MRTTYCSPQGSVCSFGSCDPRTFKMASNLSCSALLCSLHCQPCSLQEAKRKALQQNTRHPNRKHWGAPTWAQTNPTAGPQGPSLRSARKLPMKQTLALRRKTNIFWDELDCSLKLILGILEKGRNLFSCTLGEGTFSREQSGTWYCPEQSLRLWGKTLGGHTEAPI